MEIVNLKETSFCKAERMLPIIVEEDVIYLKNTDTCEIIQFKKELISDESDVYRRFGDVPFIKHENRYFVLDLKIKKMEMILDCQILDLDKSKDDFKKTEAFNYIAKKQMSISPGEKVLMMSIWHKNLNKLVYMEVRKLKKENLKEVKVKHHEVTSYKMDRQLETAMNDLQKKRDDLSEETRATKYRPQVMTGQKSGLKGRTKLNKEWSK